MAQRFGVKFIMNGAVLIPLLYLLSIGTVTQIVLSVVLFTVIAFFAGDQWILRKTNNAVATIADIGLAGLYFWAVSRAYDWDMTNSDLVITAVLAGAVDFMFHVILQKWDKRDHVFSYHEIE